MNLPGDYTHDISKSFCWLLVPLFRGRWLALRQSTLRERPCAFDAQMRPIQNGWQLVVLKVGTFHNCRATGVY